MFATLQDFHAEDDGNTIVTHWKLKTGAVFQNRTNLCNKVERESFIVGLLETPANANCNTTTPILALLKNAIGQTFPLVNYSKVSA